MSKKAPIVRTPFEMQIYSDNAQRLLHDAWGSMYERNMALVRFWVKKKLTEHERRQAETLKNKEGFLIGIDPAYISRILAQAEKEMTELEKAQAYVA